MTSKPELQLLQTQLGNASFLAARSCATGSCLVSTYIDSPSISWVANSHLVTGGEIVVDAKYSGWLQKGYLRAEWPWAVSLHRNPLLPAQCVMFVYNLVEKTYRNYDLPDEAHVALLMSYERAVAVLREKFFLVDLYAPEEETTFLTAKPLSFPLPHLCQSKAKEVLLCSMNELQLWRFDVAENRTHRGQSGDTFKTVPPTM